MRENHSLTRSVSPLRPHSSFVISFESAMSELNNSSISAAKPVPRITAFPSLFLVKLQRSRLVEPTVDQTPSITAVLAWSMPPRRYVLVHPDAALDEAERQVLMDALETMDRQRR